MATLTAEQRARLKDRQFAIPSKRKYPINDKAHARDALARVSADGTPKEKRQVRRAVKRKYPSIHQQWMRGRARRMDR